MNRKATYSGSVALISIVILISVSFNSTAMLEAEAGKRQAKTIIGVKRDWQMARYLLDKSASDAIADAATGAASGCDYDGASVASLVTPYFRDTLDDAGLEHCGINNSSVSGNENTIRIEVDMHCSKTGEGTEVQYRKDSIEFRKRAYYDNSGPSCLVDVEDRDSRVCEVDTIAGGGC